LIIVKEIFHET